MQGVVSVHGHAEDWCMHASWERKLGCKGESRSMGKGDARLEHVGSLHGRLVQVEAWSSGLGKWADVGRACRDVWCRSACVGCLLGRC